MPSPLRDQPALESEVSECVCIAECTLSEGSKTGESSQRSCTEESSIPEEEETKGIPADASADLADSTSEKSEPVVEVNENANNNRDVILHKTPVNCTEKEDPTQESIVKLGPELKETSDPIAEYGSTSGMDHETPSTGHEEESAKDQTSSEITTAGEMLDKEAESSLQNVDKQSERTAKMYPAKLQGSTEPCPGSGIFDESKKPLAASVDAQQHFPPAVSVTSSDTESPQDTIHRVPTTSPSDQEKYNFGSSVSFSEMLDLAGALPQLSPETRDFTHVRRRSMPANISTLVSSSLTNLSVGDHVPRDVGENHCDCVLGEYSGPMPSPADVPSSGETAHCFPTEVDKDLVSAAVIPHQKEFQQQACKDVVPESPQKKLPEKKGSPVKTTMILEKAVTSGVKPDRLRIPLSSSKDRLSEFRLESGLPGDLKIQVIPEVDIEKDPSREASPIPPDNSFTFNVAESGGKAPPTPTSPKSPTETPSEDATSQARIDGLWKVTVKNYPEAEWTSKEKTEPGEEIHKCDREISQRECNTPQIVHSQSVQITELHGSKVKMEPVNTARPEKSAEVLIVEKTSREENPQISKDWAATHPSSTVIVVPQAQVEEEAGEDNDIEIAEEVMEEAEVPHGANQGDEEKPTTERVRLAQSAQEDPESGAKGRSDGTQDGSNPDLAIDTVPHMDQQQPAGGVEGVCIKEDQGREATPLKSRSVSKEQGDVSRDDQTGTWGDEGVVPGAAAGEEPQTRNKKKDIVDTDKGLLKLQGT